VSDLTQSWLLYQGILFVLVMMFMPSGLAGLGGTTARLRQRFDLARIVPLVALSVGAALLLSLGGTFAIEMLQRVFSQDYRAMARLQPAGAWPPLQFLGRAWLPAAFATWAVPAALLASGAWLAHLARQRLRALADAESPSAAGANAHPSTRLATHPEGTA